MLEPSNLSVWKQLFRAAKAKQKLKLRVTVQDSEVEDNRPKPVTVEDEPEQESQDFAQTKPEAPLISTASSEATEVMPEAFDRPLQASSGVTLWETPQEEAALVDALRRVQLAGGESAPQQDTPSGNTSSVCVAPKAANFAVCCNNCDCTIPDAHYHCSTCDDGDFDLCPQCVDLGVTCYNSDHWLLKRFVKGDSILVSTTERVPPKHKAEESPNAAKIKEVMTEITRRRTETEENRPAVPGYRPVAPVSFRDATRTCNSCVQELPDKEFLHCTNCEDFDLCKACFTGDKHGHHPQHGFVPAVEGTRMPAEVSRRLAPGRDQRHYAICDGCDKFIFGVRHKCLDCPDWDYCAACVPNAAFIHPNHRFVPIYDQVADARTRTTSNRPCHYGICCDGPLCQGKRKTYIVGDRYKCSVCHDTDFCANCEANPSNNHNRTHPLIKLKTPVRRVEVTTKGEDERGQKMPVMGDRLSRKPVSSRATETSSPNSATTSLRTVVDMKPEPECLSEKKTTAATGSWSPTPSESSLGVSRTAHRSRDLKAEMESVLASAKLEALKKMMSSQRTPSSTAESLIAVFQRDTVTDGTVMPPNQVFEQTWVLRNGGDIPWPVGCSVKFVGGDYMGHIDSSHPAGIRDLVSASESTVSYNAVLPGQEFAFTVLLRTPAREGKVISWWRLTTKDGHKFGHRLWCDVTVQAPKAVEAAPVAPMEAKKTTAESVKEETEQKDAKSSQMIFPTLDKESPEGSIHQDIKFETAEVVDEDGFEFEDGEDEEWAEASDDGFLTDEEYDILDASDDEFVGEEKKMQK